MSMLAVRVAKRQWATTADPGIFSQIVICLFASGYLRYIVLQYVGPDTWRIWTLLMGYNKYRIYKGLNTSDELIFCTFQNHFRPLFYPFLLSHKA